MDIKDLIPKRATQTSALTTVGFFMGGFKGSLVVPSLFRMSRGVYDLYFNQQQAIDDFNNGIAIDSLGFLGTIAGSLAMNFFFNTPERSSMVFATLLIAIAEKYVAPVITPTLELLANTVNSRLNSHVA